MSNGGVGSEKAVEAAQEVARNPREVTVCNFELSPELFRQRRVEMLALADERRLARAMKPARVQRARSRRKVRISVTSPIRLNPSPVPR